MTLALVWWSLRYVEYALGFVQFSTFRLAAAAVIPLCAVLAVALVTSPILDPVAARFRKCRITPVLIFMGFVGLAVAGYALYWSRSARGAHMGDVDLFRQSVLSTARFEGLLRNPYEGGSHFRAHMSPFLLGLVPLVWILGGGAGWHTIQLVHSSVIVLWAFVTGGLYARLVGFRQARTMLLAGFTLYLATYTQHAGFYDTRFAALGIALFALGLESRRKWLTWTGYSLTLASRETAALLLLVMIVLLPAQWMGKRERIGAIGIAAAWFVGSVITMLYLGGPVSMGRFAPCLTAPNFSPAYGDCLLNAMTTDWPLKMGYSLRLLLFGDFAIRAIAVPLGIAPDLLTIWLSRDNVLYSLSCHYYMPTLTVALVMGALALRRSARLHQISLWVFIWFVATGLWQFVTTFHPRLF